MGPRNTHLSSQKVYCWLDGGDVVSYLSIDYPTMIHYNKYRSYYLLSLRWGYQFITSGDVRVSVGPKTTHFFSPKVNLVTDRHDGGFRTSQNHHTVSPMSFIGVGIIKLVLLVVLNLMLLL